MTMDFLNKAILGLFKAETFRLKFLTGSHSCHPWIGFPTLTRHCRLIGQALFSRSQVFVFLMDCHNLFLLLVSTTKIRIYFRKHNISVRILVSLPCVTISQRTPEPDAEPSLLELCWGNGVLGQSQRTIHPPPASFPLRSSLHPPPSLGIVQFMEADWLDFYDFFHTLLFLGDSLLVDCFPDSGNRFPSSKSRFPMRERGWDYSWFFFLVIEIIPLLPIMLTLAWTPSALRASKENIVSLSLVITSFIPAIGLVKPAVFSFSM